MKRSWNIAVDYCSQKYNFFGTFIRDGIDVYCFCDNANLFGCGKSEEEALAEMRSNAIVLLDNYNDIHELEDAVRTQKVFLISDLLSDEQL